MWCGIKSFTKINETYECKDIQHHAFSIICLRTIIIPVVFPFCRNLCCYSARTSQLSSHAPHILTPAPLTPYLPLPRILSPLFLTVSLPRLSQPSSLTSHLTASHILPPSTPHTTSLLPLRLYFPTPLILAHVSEPQSLTPENFPFSSNTP